MAVVREEIEDMRTDERAPKAAAWGSVVLSLSLAVIILSSVGMVEAATDLGSRWGVSDIVVGTLVLASLTSLPNLLTAVRLALHGRGAAVVSEAFNSNSLNVLAGIALPALAISLGKPSGLATFSVWWLVGMTIFAVLLTYARQGLRRPDGLLIILLYVVFVAVVAAR